MAWIAAGYRLETWVWRGLLSAGKVYEVDEVYGFGLYLGRLEAENLAWLV